MVMTVNEMRDHVETDLVDSALTRILTAEDKVIDKRLGDLAAVTETYLASGLEFLFVKRPIATITSIAERRSETDDPTVLDADDYRQLGNRRLRRLTSGTNPATYWGEEVIVVYDPVNRQEIRDRTLIDLVKLNVEFRGLDKEKVGDWEGEQQKYQDRRDEVLRDLDDGLPLA